MSDMKDPLELPVVDRPDWPRHGEGAFPILVGVTFDATGEAAVRFALETAKWRPGTKLHFAHVLPKSALANRSATIEQRTRELEEYPKRLADFAKAFMPAEHPYLAVHVRIGDPAQTLLQLALDYDCELLVVGTHGRKGIERLALGSVAKTLLDARRIPVLIATPRSFDGMDRTRIPDPECPDCLAAREESGGDILWCEHHGRVHVRTSMFFSNSEWLPMGGHDPGIIP